jgi:glutamate-5-semialdehyde dehydrogenase
VNVTEIAALAKTASIRLGTLARAQKDAALKAVRDALSSNAEALFAANGADLLAAESEGLSSPLLKRLRFDGKKLEEVLSGIDSLIGLPDPAGRVLAARELSPGMVLRQVSCPLGVIGMVFESRPDALVQIACLCLKSGNAVLLKGGREAARTNAALAECIRSASELSGIPRGWLHNLESREDVGAMLKLDGLVDLVIPRGSNEFVKYIMANSSIPVMGHADGVCHVYVDAAADAGMAVKVCVDSKTQYVAVCNAAETFLVHSSIAAGFLPELSKALKDKGVQMRGCERTRALIECLPASEEDWRTEYLDYVVSVKVVDSLQEAVDHVNRYGSHHTDAIVTADGAAAEAFMSQVDSACVFWNASTRFADGFKFGLGAEVGISTSKLHARGPVGLEGLVIYKWKLYGSGDAVADYAEGRKAFSFKELPAE